MKAQYERQRGSVSPRPIVQVHVRSMNTVLGGSLLLAGACKQLQTQKVKPMGKIYRPVRNWPEYIRSELPQVNRYPKR